MVRGGYFCTAGYTETGGMHAFLQKIAPDVEWQRCFPAVSKPAPKIGRPHAEPHERHAGATGRRLIDAMLAQLREHVHGAACNVDFVLLIDDADCRFADANDPSAEQVTWANELAQRVRDAAGKPDLEFYALLAWPEIEAWLLADWDNGFAMQYRQVAPSLRQHMATCVLSPHTWQEVEQFGGGLKAGSCAHKLSARIQQSFVDPTGCACRPPFLDRVTQRSDGARLAYSKRIDGAAMLKRIHPGRVAKDCPRFRSVYDQLRAAASSDRVTSDSIFVEQSAVSVQRK